MSGTLTSQEVFGFLLPDQVNTLSDASEKITKTTGELIYERGDKAEDFFIVLEGEVTLKLPLSAQCTGDAQLLKVKSSALKGLMDRDPRLGYTLQGYISTAYFNRYIDTMRKLQSIVMNLPVEA